MHQENEAVPSCFVRDKGKHTKLELEMLREEAKKCTKCPELVRNRTNVVFGEGVANARIMMCGEAPGQTEDGEGRPFVGAAGRLLDNIIKACGWDRDEIYICNTVCCRPPNNRVPTQTERDNCRNYLDAQISLVKPKYLILLGSTASGNLLGMSITEARTSVRSYNGIKTVCTYHPAYLLRNPHKKKDVWEDLQVVIRGLRQDSSHENH